MSPITDPIKAEREWLASLREAARNDSVGEWLACAIDERLRELDARNQPLRPILYLDRTPVAGHVTLIVTCRQCKQRVGIPGRIETLDEMVGEAEELHDRTKPDCSAAQARAEFKARS